MSDQDQSKDTPSQVLRQQRLPLSWDAQPAKAKPKPKTAPEAAAKAAPKPDPPGETAPPAEPPAAALPGDAAKSDREGTSGAPMKLKLKLKAHEAGAAASTGKSSEPLLANPVVEATSTLADEPAGGDDAAKPATPSSAEGSLPGRDAVAAGKGAAAAPPMGAGPQTTAPARPVAMLTRRNQDQPRESRPVAALSARPESRRENASGNDASSGASATPARVRPAGVAAHDKTPLGEILRRTREERQMSVEDVVHATQIRPDFVRALEQPDYADLPIAAIYAKRYLQRLGELYGLDGRDLVRRYQDVASEPLSGTRARAGGADIFKPPADLGDGAAEGQGSFPRVGWGMAAVACVVAVIVLISVSLGRLRPQPPTDTGRAAPAAVTDRDVEKLLLPETLPFSELPVPPDH